jgi:hypothetical protein
MNESQSQQLRALISELAAPSMRRSEQHSDRKLPAAHAVTSHAGTAAADAQAPRAARPEPPRAPPAPPARARHLGPEPPRAPAPPALARSVKADTDAAVVPSARPKAPAANEPAAAESAPRIAEVPSSTVAEAHRAERHAKAERAEAKVVGDGTSRLAEVVHISRADSRFEGPPSYKSSPAIPLPKRVTHEALLDAPWGSTLRWLGSLEEPAGATAPVAEASQESLLETPWGTLLSALIGENEGVRMDVSGVILVNGHQALPEKATDEHAILADVSSWE